MANKWKTANGVLASKLVQKALRVLKKGGTTLPGRAALAFDKKILETISRGMEVIVVTGTNGKTSTCRMIEHAYELAGVETIANRSGANLLTGVTAEFAANATVSGKPKKKVAVIECDEGAMKQVVPLLKPKVILVSNLFRDQLDRYGEVMHTLEAIRTAVRLVPESILCLNADCSLTSSLADGVPNPVYYFGMSGEVGTQKEAAISDARYCIRCGTEYEYDYHTYAHLGGFRCPKCGYKRKSPQVEVTDIGAQGMQGGIFHVRIAGMDHPAGPDGQPQEKPASAAGESTAPDAADGASEYDVKSSLPAIYNIYNAAGAICTYMAAGHPAQDIVTALADVKSSFGRMETFRLDGVPIQMILVKNPAGCNQSLTYLTSMENDYNAVFCLNDRTADGHDISWIWDADFEKVSADPHRKKILVRGDRAEDMQLRLKYAGVDEADIQLAGDDGSIIEWIRGSELPVFILPNYTAMLSLRARLSQVTGKGEFWKG